eukprot:TRINITY_DN13654_c0_g1_i6.p1 TRINITY_DN13654_c0_g1~~TRINITY_DN13654_c0_g1_i6.p1  ORF type:complete len:133 (-),score=12.61 TRINITY_DN13654_c0_g1_i6:248-646(-)
MSGPHPFSTISEKRSMASFINPSLQSPSMMVLYVTMLGPHPFSTISEKRSMASFAKPIDDGIVCNYVRSTPLLHHFRKEVYGLFHQPLFFSTISEKRSMASFINPSLQSPSMMAVYATLLGLHLASLCKAHR